MFNRRKFNAALAENGMSLKELAHEIGVDPATLSKKVNGRSDFTRKEINEICVVLNLDSPIDIFFAKELA